ncbi:MAG: AraC family transcriptional regulator [Phenylobacterium sp.]
MDTETFGPPFGAVRTAARGAGVHWRRGDGPAARAPRGGLAAWQARRAKAMLLASIPGQVGLNELADACRLSRSHFARAFKATTGLPPHQWLVAERVRLAKRLLATTGKSVEQVGAACGFADQSHFTRMFARAVGETPARWRRERRS